MTLKLVTAPTIEPVTLAETKTHMRVEHSDDDDLITALIVTARQQAEHDCGRALITQTWDRYIDAFPEAEVELGMPPVRSVTGVYYTDSDGVAQTLDAAEYVTDLVSEPGWILPAAGYAWPATYDSSNAARVRFVCGYGDAAADVPSTIKSWILMRVATLYKFREEIASGVSIAELPGRYVDLLLRPFQVLGH